MRRPSGSDEPRGAEQLELLELRVAPIAVGDLATGVVDPELALDTTNRRPPKTHRWTPMLRRIAAISRLTPVRLLATGVVGIALGVAAAMQLRAPAPGRPTVLSTSPLTATECLTGRCSATVATADKLADVREALGPAYQVSGLRTTDPRGVLRQISVVAADGENTVIISGTRTTSVPKSWRSERSSNPDPNLPAQLVNIRVALVSPSDRGKWIVELQSASPRGSPQLVQALHRLAADPALVV